MEKKRFKVVIILLIVIIILLFFSIVLINGKAASKGRIEEIEPLPSEEPVLDDSVDIKPIPDIVPVETRGALYFVIDDVGNNLFQLKPFLKLPMNITFAVLPGLKIGHIWTEELASILLDLNNLTQLFTGNEFDEDSWY